MAIPGSTKDVVTTVGLTLAKLMVAYKEEMPEMQYVYDEKLTYETALAKFRSDNNLEANSEIATPLLAFKRSVLRHVKENSPGRRMGRRLVAQQKDSTQSNEFRSVHGEYDIEFLLITPKMVELEQFEIAFLGEEGISGIKQVDVELPAEFGGGTLPYYIEYEELADKLFETEGNYYKTLSGIARLRGHFLVFRGEASHILEINGILKDKCFPDVIYSQIQCTSP